MSMSPNQFPPDPQSKKAKRLNNIARAIRRKAQKITRESFDYYEHEMRNDKRVRFINQRRFDHDMG